MNRHLCRLCLLGMLFAVPVAALGQASQIAPSIRSASSISSAQQQSIEEAIKADMALLTSADPAKQQQARDSLSDAMRDQGQMVASAVFKRIYATALNQALADIPEKAEIRIRLNAAIVTARAAQLAANTQLARAAIRFMNDPEMPVSLWGLKAARWILPYEAATILFSADDELLKAIPAAALRNPTGPMLEEAYEALSLQLANPDVAVKPAQGSIQIVVPIVQDLIQKRTQLAINAKIDSALAETRGTNFLANPEVYRAQNAAARLRTAQVLADYLSTLGGKLGGSDDRGTLILVIQDAARAAYVVGLNEGNKSIETAATALTRIRNDVSDAEIVAMIDTLRQAIASSPTFAGLQPPPTANASTAPANGQ